MSDKNYNYLEVNRGRYLCPEHGAFCDSSDNYLDRCPLCKCDNGARLAWTPNNVDRLLQVVNGLQNRSKRNLALSASLIGGVGFLRIASEVAPDATNLFRSWWVSLPVLFGLIFLVLSLGAYALSMPHIKTTEQSSMKLKTRAEWEGYLASELEKFERNHGWGGYLFILGIAAFVVAIVAYLITTICGGW